MKIEVGKHRLPEERYLHALARFVPTLRRRRNIIIAALILVVAAGVYCMLELHGKEERSVHAWEALFKMNSAEDIDSTEDIVSDTDAEPLFALEAGRLLFDRGKKEDLERAEELYRGFCDRWPVHPGAVYAKQSLGYVLETKQSFQEAFDIFSSMVQNGGHLVNQSMWDAGRCAEKAGKTDTAKDYYRRLTEEAGSSPWALYAGTRLAELLSVRKEVEKEEKDG